MMLSAVHIDSLVQDFSNSIANALELLQSCTKLSIFFNEVNMLSDQKHYKQMQDVSFKPCLKFVLGNIL